VTCMRNRRNTNRISVGNSEQNTQIIRPKRRLDDDIKMYPKNYAGKTWVGFIRLRIR
jgi:hypothetical protein